MCSRTVKESNLYKCTGCIGDLYCPSCFESSHDENEMINNHKAVHFIKEDKLSSAKMNLIRKLLTSDSRKNNHWYFVTALYKKFFRDGFTFIQFDSNWILDAHKTIIGNV